MEAAKIKTKLIITNKRTDENKYGFKVWMKNGEKFVSDYYNLEGIKEMKSFLQAHNEVFEIQIIDENGNVEEVKI